jgi:phage terminase small subunit
MPILANSKWEKFCVDVVAGKTLVDAFVAAGYAEKNAYSAAPRLFKHPKITERIAELKDKVEKVFVEKCSINKEWVVKNLQEVAERCMQHEPVLRNGAPVMVETETGELAAVYKFDSAGANRSLELIGKEFGMFVDKKEIKMSVLSDTSDEQLDAIIAEAAQEVGVSLH